MAIFQFQAPNKDPDAGVVALFKNLPVKNEAKTAEMGRPIYDDQEIVELRYAGSRNMGVYPATAMSHWGVNDEGEQVVVTYAERFSRQYRQFKERQVQTKSGTPLDYGTFLTEARRAELRALNVYTLEALASVDGAELKNLGMMGRDMKNRAIAYLEESKTHAMDTKLMAELEALRSRNEILEGDLKVLKTKAQAVDRSDDFDDMTLDQLREYITTHTGVAPQGAVNRKTLARMARDARPDQVA